MFIRVYVFYCGLRLFLFLALTIYKNRKTVHPKLEYCPRMYVDYPVECTGSATDRPTAVAIVDSDCAKR